jgi:hypothetical protein
VWQCSSKKAIQHSAVLVAIVALVAAACSNSSHGAAGSGGATQAAAVAQRRAGVGTAAALAAPDCDRTLGRIKMPFKYAPPCVVPWPAGADNDGATYQGVTATSITIVVVGGNIVDTDKNRSEVKQAWQDIFAIYQHEFQTWGRQVKLIWEDFGAGATPDEIQQRAMATTIIDLHPFAVVAMGGGEAMTTALAGAKIPVFADGAAFDDTIQLSPYVWLPVEPGPANPLIAMSAQYVAQGLMGRPAQWAGQSDFQSRTRVFGLVYDNVISDPKFFNPFFAQYGVKLAAEIGIDSGADFAEEAPTVIAKLKAAGVTTIIDATDLEANPILTKEATSQLYFPEWVSIGTNGEDISLADRGNDQRQWAHAFGFGDVPPAPAATVWWTHLLDWYYGPGKPSWRESSGESQTYSSQQEMALMMFLGIDMAGPVLNPLTMRDGLFAYPPSGGEACGCTTMVQMSFGDHGVLPGYDNYSTGNDVVEEWWDSKDVGPDEVLGITGAGLWHYMNDAQRFTFGHFPKGEPPAFSKTATLDTNSLKALPTSDEVPNYSCLGCPSGSTG